MNEHRTIYRREFKDGEPAQKVAGAVVAGGCLSIGIIWILGTIGSLTLTGVIIWAIIRLVQHYT